VLPSFEIFARVRRFKRIPCGVGGKLEEEEEEEDESMKWLALVWLSK